METFTKVGIKMVKDAIIQKGNFEGVKLLLSGAIAVVAFGQLTKHSKEGGVLAPIKDLIDDIDLTSL